MKILIYAMPRTKSTMLASLIYSGGGQILHEPFHWKEEIRNSTFSCGNNKWNGEEDQIAYLERVLVQPVRGLKTLAAHQNERDALRLHQWADLSIHLERDLLEIACSFVLATCRNAWNRPDESPENAMTHAEKGFVEQIIHWFTISKNVERQTKGRNVISFSWDDSPQKVADELAKYGIPTGGATTGKTRDKKPSELISNLDEVKDWLNLK